VHDEITSLCTRINTAKGLVNASDIDLITDLRRRSKSPGREITLEVYPSILAYVVNPFRLP
jgi:hypothetical protein